ncbi:hypothetical protein A2Z22_05285 [Candidatus Woesebacteria bacterium RBG_16_34_12]|uniref:Glycosyltransferase 2-like domain-containing protein n=1 Tax=Candidatus Woesebacteria bacterium RBG_16_34_12 TaxID=1802480 RepID=A0A1F7X6T3_9BACT|nr:MAG: hypothetical protein A2Z22_05285 [Candidatus Woesebacteria bacterium RBG_16_34_12]
MNKLPFVSIIVCTFNGSSRISDCLDSLINQDYSEGSYEIIVINDGSIDNTLKILTKYPVKVVTHHKNLGICAARNSGLQNASGSIVAYTDDDCIADKNWVRNLVNNYGVNVMAVGGVTVPYSINTLTEKYMSETGYGNPAPIEFGKSKHPLYRFFVYLKDMSSPLINSGADTMPVQSIYTLNASFKKEIIKKAGGWVLGFNFREDQEMCDRLNRLFPSQKILFTKKAIITHKHRTSFCHFLKQTYTRSESTLKCYIKDKKIPPAFPFPVFILLMSLLGLYLSPLLTVLSLIFLPQLFYTWWLIKYIKCPKGYYLLFPYVQLSLELATILGMFRGFIKLKPDK